MNPAAMNTHHRFYTIENFFKSAHENGFQYVEIWSGPMHYYIDYQMYDDPAILESLEKKYKIKVIGICPEQTNPKPHNMATNDPDMQKRVYSYFQNAINVASRLHANQVVVTSGWCYLSENHKEAKIRSAKMMKRLVEYAMKKGVFLAIEALQKKESELVNTIEDLKEYLLLVDHPNLKICLDLGAMAGANESIEDYWKAFGSTIIHCHFVDGNPTGHMAWGDGTRDMIEDLNVIKKCGYKGYLSFEIVHSQYFKRPDLADLQCMYYYRQWEKTYRN